MIIPMDAPVKISTFATMDYLGKTVITGKITFFSGRADMNNATAHQFSLDLHKDFLRNNGFVIILDIVLGDNSVILDACFC